MTRNFKHGFSYIELVFAMVIVVILLAVSAPFMTRKNLSSTGSGYGEYQCWAVYDETDGWVLYEKSRYNTAVYDNPNGKKVLQCRFMKPINVDSYEVTLVSGGGGGSMPYYVDDVYDGIHNLLKNKDVYSEPRNLSSNTCGTEYTTYNEVDVKYYLEIVPGSGGESGNVTTFNSTLHGAFDDDNEIKVNLCDTEVPTTYDSNSYKTRIANNNNFCVGKGGDGAIATESPLSNIEPKIKFTPLNDYYRLLSFYDDWMYVNKKGESSVPYFGTGDINYRKGTDNEILNSYFNQDERKSIDQSKLESKLKELVRNPQSPTNIHTSTGFNGGYTHFSIKGETNSILDNEYCYSGNCVVKGGKGGVTNNIENKITIDIQEQCGDKNNRDKNYHCFGENFGNNTIGEYNNEIAKQGNPAVIIGDKKADKRYINNYLNNHPNENEIMLKTSGDLKAFDKVNINNDGLGAGGGAGGFTFYTSVEPYCKALKFKNGDVSLDVSLGNNESCIPTNLKNSITCSGNSSFADIASNRFNRSNTIFKVTQGGRGSGGAIIIKW